MGWRDNVSIVSGDKFTEPTADATKLSDDQVLNIIDEYNIPAQTVRQIAQGASFGFGDEIEAGIRSFFGKRDYKDIRDELRTKQQLFEQDYPLAATGLELAGSIAAPLGVAKTALGQTKVAKQVGDALKSGSAKTRIGTGAAVGGASGAMYGAGTAQEISDIPKDAATMGAVGAVGGAVLPEAIRGIGSVGGSVVRNIGERLGKGDADANATRLLAQRLADEGLDEQGVTRRLNEYKEAGVSDAVIADLGETLKDLGYLSYSIPSKSKTATREFLEGRASDVKQETFANLSQSAGIPTDKLGVNYLDELIATNKQRAKDAYKGIEGEVISTAPFRRYKDRDVMKKAYKEAEKLANAEGESIVPYEQLFDGTTVSIKTLQQIKRGLDAEISGAGTKDFKLTPYGGSVSALRKEFDSLIKSKNKAYKEADELFATDVKITDAYKMGEKYNTMDVRTLRKNFLNATDAEKKAFRVGMMSNIEKELQKMTTNDLSAKIFKSQKQKEALRYVFPTTESFNKFKDMVKLQQNKLDTGRQVLGGSQTGKRELIKEEAETTQQVLNYGLNVASGQGVIPAALGALRGLVNQARISPATAESLKQKLFQSSNVDDVLKEITELQKKQAMRPAPKTSYYGGVIPSLLATEEEIPVIDIVGGQYPR